ncbi:MAG: hypothetical protein QOG57_3643, partial [Pseudonocardiales bacterium]|nr:hypothetical protein [Pseudonocardiales bacterium]
AEAPGPHLRISFADTTGTDEITDGIHRIAAACTATLVEVGGAVSSSSVKRRGVGG